jgi:hypothetical protein
MITVNKLCDLSSQNNFLAYKGTKDKSVLFIGSCRIAPIMFYFNQMFPEHNVYGIYVPHWTDTSKLCKNTIQKNLHNTDLIITESIKNFNILNTDKTLENNFFKTFDTNATQIKISNLELHMYIHELVNIFNVSAENMSSYFEQSKEKLRSSLINKNQEFIWNFIDNNLKNLRLFSTHNHPTRILSILTFIKVANIMGCALDFEFIKKVSKYDFLEGNSTPITYVDVEKYKFKFKTKIFENNVIYDKSFLYNPTEEEKIVCDSTIEKILEAQNEMSNP